MKKIRIGHIGIHDKANLNSGDTLLFQVVRDIFEHSFSEVIDWNLYQVWEEFDEEKIQIINEECDLVVLGGGGLLLKDQKGSDARNSGWQWNCIPENVSLLEKPLIIYAIGYNRFYNQEEFDPAFSDSMNAIAKMSPFFSLRNNGSVKAVKSYLTEKNNQEVNIFRQFCPTTIISKVYPELLTKSLDHKKKNKRVLSFNAAFDRAEMRFKDPKAKFLEIASLMKDAHERGWSIVACSHKDMDREIEEYLDLSDVTYKVKDLTRSSPLEIMEHYAEIDLSVGMRGHSQMIPFGLNKPIISLISHDKLKFFLEDLDLLKLGIDLTTDNVRQSFNSILDDYEFNNLLIEEDLLAKQEIVWSETVGNFSVIKSTF